MTGERQGRGRGRTASAGALALAVALGVLGGCGGSDPPPAAAPDPDPPLYTVIEAVQCVPFARAASGIEIRGDAWTWWETAAGRYARGVQPQAGAVLVLRRTGRLRHGHIAVVVAVAGPREIHVTHANWGWDRETRDRAYHAMPVIDVSPGNDWSETRFYNYDTGAYGRVYPAHGFIYAHRA